MKFSLRSATVESSVRLDWGQVDADPWFTLGSLNKARCSDAQALASSIAEAKKRHPSALFNPTQPTPKKAKPGRTFAEGGSPGLDVRSTLVKIICFLRSALNHAVSAVSQGHARFIAEVVQAVDCPVLLGQFARIEQPVRGEV